MELFLQLSVSTRVLSGNMFLTVNLKEKSKRKAMLTPGPMRTSLYAKVPAGGDAHLCC